MHKRRHWNSLGQQLLGFPKPNGVISNRNNNRIKMTTHITVRQLALIKNLKTRNWDGTLLIARKDDFVISIH
ncbi:hypothetical protein B5G21_02835 [Enorma massiliensis]|uniref:Uncharacterized protein n=1 Tax=Enorma massiliensis TaxID=1472761 RepID=A0A1Y3U664_9ACTN|nr:hypothetical protein B5G21_02835 [Enorma massiliensis]